MSLHFYAFFKLIVKRSYVTSYLGAYCAITLSTCVLYAISYLLSMRGAVRAARVINAKLIDSILRSPLR